MPGIVHPENPAINALSTAQLTGPAHDPKSHLRNAVIISTGDVRLAAARYLDRRRSTVRRAAPAPARAWPPCTRAVKLALGQPFRHESVLGTVFTGCLVEETRVGPYQAVVPTLSGQAWITGISQYVLDAEDPFPEGFVVGDLWPVSPP